MNRLFYYNINYLYKLNLPPLIKRVNVPNNTLDKYFLFVQSYKLIKRIKPISSKTIFLNKNIFIITNQ